MGFWLWVLILIFIYLVIYLIIKIFEEKRSKKAREEIPGKVSEHFELIEESKTIKTLQRTDCNKKKNVLKFLFQQNNKSCRWL